AVEILHSNPAEASFLFEGQLARTVPPHSLSDMKAEPAGIDPLKLIGRLIGGKTFFGELYGIEVFRRNRRIVILTTSFAPRGCLLALSRRFCDLAENRELRAVFCELRPLLGIGCRSSHLLRCLRGVHWLLAIVEFFL